MPADAVRSPRTERCAICGSGPGENCGEYGYPYPCWETSPGAFKRAQMREAEGCERQLQAEQRREAQLRRS